MKQSSGTPRAPLAFPSPSAVRLVALVGMGCALLCLLVVVRNRGHSWAPDTAPLAVPKAAGSLTRPQLMQPPRQTAATMIWTEALALTSA